MSEGERATDRVWTVPNILSFLRLALLAPLMWCFATDRVVLAGVVLVLTGLTDLVDGKIARSFHQESRLGQILDPVADRAFTAMALLGLAWVEVIPWWLVLVLVARDAAILGLWPAVHTYRLPLPEVDFVGKSATFCLLGAFPTLLLAHLGGGWETPLLALGWALMWWGVVLYWVAGGIYAWQVLLMARLRRGQTEVTV